MSDSIRFSWEYKVVRPDRGPALKEVEDPETTLNECGKHGWELTETIDYVGGGTKYLVFKRRRGVTNE
ncbi:DUF4177 domain-containing protein [Halobacteria archaeon AArc-m2/3/4]|uniref:DUF4177 domain-containing protein n=1 Tax=Natronoglomus mannanivorans TaxID=2979990 RepID=A0AAP2Z2G4_9EURY|nr:DUF4177 domain-containing protein [Halobacteria archaeon AArc-xg1-1]MCU4974767.1 DUF4177 domain-containing protein [Halobacteria archaeon AArc-m2/3/4]